MSVFSASITHRSFWFQISVLCFVLGLLLAAAAHTATQINRTGVGPSNVALSYGPSMQVAAHKAAESEKEINKLREHITELENQVAKGTGASSTLNHELQDTKFLAGLTETEGPGIQVTLTDASKGTLQPSGGINLGNYIHDVDIANVVNELKAAGAEAVAVNGQRVVTSTAIRCVGPVVHVNFVPAAPPYLIEAIGDPNTLFGGLNLPQGVLDEIRRSDPTMVHIEKKNSVHLPAFAGSTQFRFAHTVKPAKKDDRSKDKN